MERKIKGTRHPHQFWRLTFGIGAFRSFVNRLQKSTLFLSGRDAFCRSFSQFCLAFYKKPERHPQGEHGFEAIGKRSAWGLRA